jgi:hypothetical protein
MFNVLIEFKFNHQSLHFFGLSLQSIYRVGGVNCFSLFQNEMRDNVKGLFLILFFSHVHTCLLSEKMFLSQRFSTAAMDATRVLILKLHKKY